MTEDRGPLPLPNPVGAQERQREKKNLAQQQIIECNIRPVGITCGSPSGQVY